MKIRVKKINRTCFEFLHHSYVLRYAIYSPVGFLNLEFSEV